MIHSPYRFVRLKLATLGLLPRTRLARFTAYLAAIDLLFYLLRTAFALTGSPPAGVASLGGWITFLTFWVVVLGLVLLLRWLRERLMWRLRNRLIVTYVFIGVIPVFLLAAIAGISAYLLAGQFATFVATGDVQGEVQKLDASNSVLAADIAGELRSGVPPARAAQALRAAPHGTEVPPEITFWYRGQPTVVHSRSQAEPRPIAAPGWLPGEFRGVVAADGKLWLRAAKRLPIGAESVTVISSVPLDKALLDRLAANLGEITLYAAKLSFAPEQRRLVAPGESTRGLVPGSSTVRIEGPARTERLFADNISGGRLPPQQHRLDKATPFPTPFTITDWNTGESAAVPMSVLTRPSLLYGRLFLTLGEFSGFVFQGLIVVAMLFALIEIFALFIGVRLTRSMTSSVAALYQATQHIERGDLRHRIQVRSRDQLAALETSFNSMSESLQKLLLEQKEKERIQNELAIAQEVQEQLFPQHAGEVETLEVHGLCRPARTVSGDYYDFLPLGHERLGIAVGDISGKGISAALLMATIHSAVRAYTLDRSLQAQGVEVPLLAAVGAGPRPPAAARENGNGFATADPAELLTLLNRQLYHSTPLEKYATLFLGAYDGLSRRLTYSNAGHLAPIILSPDGALRRLDVGGTVVGLFDSVSYEQATVELRPGDIFIAFSDGITEPENEFGEFGEHRLVDLVRENRGFPLDRVSEAVTTAVRDWIGGAEQPDDITIVLARAR